MFVLCVAAFWLFFSANAQKREAFVRLTDTKGVVFGDIRFVEEGSEVKVTGKLENVEKPGDHGFHVHQLGDLSEGCTSSKGHYNPMGVNHGDLDATTRHIGDLGNVKAENGIINVDITLPSKDLPLSGKYSIIGRTLVLHEDPDDLGKGQGASLENGNAGKRIGCGIIGYASDFAVAKAPVAGSVGLWSMLTVAIAALAA